MSRQLQKVEKEGTVNSLIRNKKNKDFTILYYSLWDKMSSKVFKEAETWVSKEGKKEETLHTVTSWELPHAFMAFSVTSVPSLVVCKRGKIFVESYPPRILDYLSK
jgi:hypothetical protein